MADREYDLSKSEDRQEVKKALTDVLKNRIEAYTSELRGLRERELAKAEGKKFSPGDRVRMTGKFLRNTGQHTGPEGQSVWTVKDHPGCSMCERGNHVAVDQDSYDGSGPRHIAVAHLEHSKSKIKKSDDLALPMAKGESCLLCKQDHSLCKCMGSMKKNAAMGYGPKDPGMASSNGPVAGSGPAMGGMAMSEKSPTKKGEDYIDGKNGADKDKRIKTVGKDAGVLPGDKKPKKVKAEGSGGEISKGKALKKEELGKGAMPPPVPAAAAKPKAGPPPTPGAAKPKAAGGLPSNVTPVKAPAAGSLKPVKLPGMPPAKESAASLVQGLKPAAKAEMSAKTKRYSDMIQGKETPPPAPADPNKYKRMLPPPAAKAELSPQTQKYKTMMATGKDSPPPVPADAQKYKAMLPKPMEKGALSGTSVHTKPDVWGGMDEGAAAPARKPMHGPALIHSIMQAKMASGRALPSEKKQAQAQPQLGPGDTISMTSLTGNPLSPGAPKGGAALVGAPPPKMPGTEGLTAPKQAKPAPKVMAPPMGADKPQAGMAVHKSEKFVLGACALCNKPEHGGNCK